MMMKHLLNLKCFSFKVVLCPSTAKSESEPPKNSSHWNYSPNANPCRKTNDFPTSPLLGPTARFKVFRFLTAQSYLQFLQDRNFQVLSLCGWLVSSSPPRVLTHMAVIKISSQSVLRRKFLLFFSRVAWQEHQSTKIQKVLSRQRQRQRHRPAYT